MIGLVFGLAAGGGSDAPVSQVSKLSPTVKGDSLTFVDERVASLSIIRQDLVQLIKSPSIRKEILDAIDKSAQEYSIPHILLHGIFRTESSYRWEIEHPQVNHRKLGKVRAVGLGGILWEVWGDSLIAHGIAYERKDLFDKKTNIMATGYVLRTETNYVLKNVTSDPRRIVREVIRRYYGVYSKLYENKLKEATSDLWMQRIGMQLLSEEEEASKED